MRLLSIWRFGQTRQLPQNHMQPQLQQISAYLGQGKYFGVVMPSQIKEQQLYLLIYGTVVLG